MEVRLHRLDDITTLAASVLLIARPTLLNYAAGELTQLLLATKAKIAASVPEAGQLHRPTPPTAMPSCRPTLGRSQTSTATRPVFFDEATNYISFATMFTGGFAAFAAWITSLRNRRQLRELKQYTERLPALLEGIKEETIPGPSRCIPERVR